MKVLLRYPGFPLKSIPCALRVTSLLNPTANPDS